MLNINGNGSGGPKADLPRIMAEIDPRTGQINFMWPIDPASGRINEMYGWLLYKRLGMAMEKAALDGADQRPPMIAEAKGPLPLYRPGQHP